MTARVRFQDFVKALSRRCTDIEGTRLRLVHTTGKPYGIPDIFFMRYCRNEEKLHLISEGDIFSWPDAVMEYYGVVDVALIRERRGYINQVTIMG